MADSSGQSYDKRPWEPVVNRALAYAEEKGVRIVGVTGHSPGVGVSMLVNEFAHAYARHGYKVILVDASRIGILGGGFSEPNTMPMNIQAMSRELGAGISLVEIAEHKAHLSFESEAFKEAFQQAIVASPDVAIVVDLPPALAKSEEHVLAFCSLGAACQLVYLVCLSGEINNAELHNCIESCKLGHVPIAGIIVNDWKLPIARIAGRQ